MVSSLQQEMETWNQVSFIFWRLYISWRFVFFLLKFFCFNNTNTSVRSFLFFPNKDIYIYRKGPFLNFSQGTHNLNPPLLFGFRHPLRKCGFPQPARVNQPRAGLSNRYTHCGISQAIEEDTQWKQPWGIFLFSSLNVSDKRLVTGGKQGNVKHAMKFQLMLTEKVVSIL